MPEEVTVESPYNASLIHAGRGLASLRATDPALSLLPAQENSAMLGYYVNATSAVSKHMLLNTDILTLIHLRCPRRYFMGN